MSENNIIDFDYNGSPWRLEIIEDPDPTSPREGENLGLMLYHHKNYILGDEKITFSSFDEYLESAKIDPNTVVSLPLYLYDHSGLRMSVDDFQDPWDSSCVGVIFVTHDKIKQEFGDLSEESIENALSCLRKEVEIFDQYISGNAYGFVLSQKVGDSFEERESCWGFYGDDPLKNGMVDFLDDNIKECLNKKLTKSFKP